MKLLAVETSQWRSYYSSRYEQIEQLGGEVHLLCGESTPDSWRRRRDANSLRLDHMIALARDWHAEQHFDGVLTFAEMSVTATAAIAEALGLPGIGAAAARASRNKLTMREAHRRHHVPHPRFAPVTDIDEALQAAAEIGYPVILKPTLGASSAFVFRIDSPQEMTERYPYAAAGIREMISFTLEAHGADLGPNILLVESFLDGPEVLVEGTVWDGEFFTGVVVDRVTVEGKTFDDDVHHAPSGLAADVLTEVHQVVAKAVAAQQLSRSVVHAEVRFHEGRPYILEAAARLGGGSMDGMSRLSGGHDPVRAAMDIAVDRRPDLGPYAPTGIHTAGICMLTQPGVVADVFVPGETAAHSQLLYLQVATRAGDVIKRPPNGNDMFAYLYTSGTSFGDAMTVAEDLAQSIKVTFVPE